MGFLQMQVLPNPNNGIFEVKFNTKSSADVKIIISDINGRTIEQTVLSELGLGEHIYSKKIDGLTDGGIYFITIETDGEKATQKIVIE